MAEYTRQSTFTDGDIITAAHSNDEFNKLLAAFVASTGHSHDGTAGEGGPVTTLRDTDSLNKIFVDTSNNHLEFYVEVSSSAVQQLRIQDGAIVPITDNDIDLGTSSLEFKDLHLDGTANIDSLVADTADINGGTIDGVTLGTNSAITQAVIDNININGATIGHTDDTDLLTLADGIITVAGEISVTTLDIGGTNVTSTAAELNILDGVTSTAAELNILDGVTSTAAELNILDGVTATATEINIIDGDTTATSTTVVDADRVVFNDAGTMKQVAVTDLAAYFDDEITAMPNLTSVGTLTTLTVDNVIINGTTIGHTDDTDLITVADGIVTVAGEISVTTLDIGGTNVTSTAAELNIIDGDTSATSTTLADADRVVVNDAGTMKQVALTDFETYFESALDTLSNVTTVGALNSGSITSGFGAIDNGSSAITTTGTITYGSLSDGSITITAFVDEDDMTSNSATLVPTQQSVKAYVDAQITAEDLDFQADSGGALSIDLDSETLTFTGGTGIDTSGSGNAVTFAIDSTVATLTGTQTLTNKTLTTPIANAGVQLKNGATSAGFLEFFEDSDNGTNKVTLIGPASTADVTLTLPSATDTIVGKATTDTLTNKSIDSDNNTITNIVNADIKSSAAIADTKLDTISTANKVALTALDIDGGSDIGADLTTSDLIVVDDGAGGTNKKAALSRLTTFITAQGFTSDDPTALAIALG